MAFVICFLNLSCGKNFQFCINIQLLLFPFNSRPLWVLAGNMVPQARNCVSQPPLQFGVAIWKNLNQKMWVNVQLLLTWPPLSHFLLAKELQWLKKIENRVVNLEDLLHWPWTSELFMEEKWTSIPFKPLNSYYSSFVCILTNAGMQKLWSWGRMNFIGLEKHQIYDTDFVDLMF